MLVDCWLGLVGRKSNRTGTGPCKGTVHVQHDSKVQWARAPEISMEAIRLVNLIRITPTSEKKDPAASMYFSHWCKLWGYERAKRCD